VSSNERSILGRFPLAPLTRGGNLPFRRLCKDFGATATCSEMAYAHQVVKIRGRQPTLFRHHASEDNFGVQLAASKPQLAAEAARVAQGFGAKFVDLNCGCPIYDTVQKGMGARLLQKVNKLGHILEAMVEAVDIPVTVKLRTGFTEHKVNIRETVRVAIEAGVQTIVIHGRTREQRYSRAADWDLVAEIARDNDVPVLGNGDILTPMEARARINSSAIAGAMIARGALIKPWLFKELSDDREWLPSVAEQWSIIIKFTNYLKEHFGIDELGRRRGLDFLAWHLDWFSRYRPLPEQAWAEQASEYPLLQTRTLGDAPISLPGKGQEAERQQLAGEIWDSSEAEELLTRFVPSPTGQGELSASEQVPG
jgi:tRNA-dihydrouridine synthase 3